MEVACLRHCRFVSMVRFARLRTQRLGFVILLPGPDGGVPTARMHPTIRSQLALAVVMSVGASGCDFFRELQSLPEAGEDGTGDESDDSDSDSDESGETGDAEPCDVLDESCSNQDTLHSCDYESGELVTYDCAVWCGEGALLNFTCIPSADFTHGCWCVAPGDIKLDSCWQLESCMYECGGDPNSSCTHSCFDRTDAQTIRLLGTLYSCADRACDELCVASPADCGSCLQAARAGLYGDCGVEREVCDADSNDESGWP
jgi:hypothetical protein